MRLPGSLEALSKQLKAAGLGMPTELGFDADGNLTRLVLTQPQREAPVPTAQQRQAAEERRKPSAISSLRQIPPGSVFDVAEELAR